MDGRHVVERECSSGRGMIIPDMGSTPHKVIFDGLDPGNPFCGDADRPAMPLIEQCARKVHDSVAHHDVNEADRSPPLALELRIEPLANGRVTGRPGLRLGGNARQRVQ